MKSYVKLVILRLELCLVSQFFDKDDNRYPSRKLCRIVLEIIGGVLFLIQSIIQLIKISIIAASKPVFKSLYVFQQRSTWKYHYIFTTPSVARNENISTGVFNYALRAPTTLLRTSITEEKRIVIIIIILISRSVFGIILHTQWFVSHGS